MAFEERRAYRPTYRGRDARQSPPPDRRAFAKGRGEDAHADGYPRRGEQHDYLDRDRDGYRSPRYGSPTWARSRSRSPHRSLPPNREVILEGLPPHLTEDDVRSYHIPPSPPSTVHRVLSVFWLRLQDWRGAGLAWKDRSAQSWTATSTGPTSRTSS